MDHCKGKKCKNKMKCYRYLVKNKKYSERFIRAFHHSDENGCKEKQKNLKKSVTVTKQ
jgi:hypothetical protein